MKEKNKEKIEKITDAKGLVEYLKELISTVEAGYIQFGEKRIDLPSTFELELKYKEKENKKEFEIEIEWKV